MITSWVLVRVRYWYRYITLVSISVRRASLWGPFHNSRSTLEIAKRKQGLFATNIARLMLYSSLEWDRLQWLAGHIHERIYHFITEPLQTHRESHYELKLELGSPVVPASFHCNNRPVFSRKIFRLPFGLTDDWPHIPRYASPVSAAVSLLCASSQRCNFMLCYQKGLSLSSLPLMLFCSALLCSVWHRHLKM